MVDTKNICDKESYERAVRILQARLLLFNHRRPGELEETKMVWARSRTKEEEHFVDYVKDLTALEKKLIETTEYFEIEGKKGRKVPVMVPADVKPIFHALVNDPLDLGSDYLFAKFNQPDCVMSAAEALDHIVNETSITKPEAMKSTNIRKYLSTCIQLLSLKENEKSWMMDLLGHTVNVDEVYYRTVSATLMCSKVAKLLRCIETGMITKFHGKTLDQIDPEAIPIILDDDDEAISSAVVDMQEESDVESDAEVAPKANGRELSDAETEQPTGSQMSAKKNVGKNWKRHPSSEILQMKQIPVKANKTKDKDPDWTVPKKRQRKPTNIQTNPNKTTNEDPDLTPPTSEQRKTAATVDSSQDMSDNWKEEYNICFKPAVKYKKQTLTREEAQVKSAKSHILLNMIKTTRKWNLLKNKMNAQVQKIRRSERKEYK